MILTQATMQTHVKCLEKTQQGLNELHGSENCEAIMCYLGNW